jgi:hypothetical protein
VRAIDAREDRTIVAIADRAGEPAPDRRAAFRGRRPRDLQAAYAQVERGDCLRHLATDLR